MSCNCTSNTEILRLLQELKQDLSQVKNDCFRIRQEILGITDESHEFGLMENVTIRQVMERMAFDIETLKASTEPAPERHPDNAKDLVTYDDNISAEDRLQTQDFQTQVEYEEWLRTTTNRTTSNTRVEDGASIGGRSISSISSVPSKDRSVTLEIVNFYDEPLVDLQTLLDSDTTPHGTHPTTVDAKRREVFLYSGFESFWLDCCIGALSFRIGSENHRVSVYFITRSTDTVRFGMTLTAANTTFQDLSWATGTKIKNLSEVVAKDNLPTDYVFSENIETTSTFSIEDNLIYVRATLIPDKRSIWKIEVFPKPKPQNLVSPRSALLDLSSPGESYGGKTALDFMDTFPGNLGIFVKFDNGIDVPLLHTRSFSSDPGRIDSRIPNFISSNTKKIIYWTTSQNNLTSVVTYQIGTSDIRLAVATKASTRTGNEFGLKFVSNNTNTTADSSTFDEVMNPPKWERNSHKVSRAGGGLILIHIRNLRATASMAGEPKSLLKVTLEKYF